MVVSGDSEMLRKNFLLGISTAFLLLASCAPEPHSLIVDYAEKAGSGKLVAVSAQSMQEWLAKHKDVAAQLDKMCEPVRLNAVAEWAQSTEGRLCTAARNQVFFNGSPVKGDGKAYEPGTK